MYYSVEAPDGTIVYPLGPTGYESRWICGRDRFDEMVREGLVAWKQVQRDGGTHWHPFQKFYLAGREKRPSNLWTDIEGNKKATRELRDLLMVKRSSIAQSQQRYWTKSFRLPQITIRSSWISSPGRERLQKQPCD